MVIIVNGVKKVWMSVTHISKKLLQSFQDACCGNVIWSLIISHILHNNLQSACLCLYHNTLLEVRKMSKDPHITELNFMKNFIEEDTQKYGGNSMLSKENCK